MLIVDFLAQGEENAVTQTYLRDALDFPNTRTVRKQIESERLQGYLIMSSDSGYFLPATIEEMRRYVRRYEDKLRTGEACVQPARDFLEMIGTLDQPQTIKKILKDVGFKVEVDNGQTII